MEWRRNDHPYRSVEEALYRLRQRGCHLSGSRLLSPSPEWSICVAERAEPFPPWIAISAIGPKHVGGLNLVDALLAHYRKHICRQRIQPLRGMLFVSPPSPMLFQGAERGLGERRNGGLCPTFRLDRIATLPREPAIFLRLGARLSQGDEAQATQAHVATDAVHYRAKYPTLRA